MKIRKFIIILLCMISLLSLTGCEKLTFSCSHNVTDYVVTEYDGIY